MAVKDAGLDINEEISDRVGVWIGSGIGGMETFETQYQNFLNKGYRRVSPFFVPMLIPDMAAGQVSITLGARGVNSCTVTACATGTNSIGDAFKVIQRGDAIAMISGGAEAPITNMSIAGFCANTALSTNPDPKTACRPFDANRDGFVIGEGAGIVVLEEFRTCFSTWSTYLCRNCWVWFNWGCLSYYSTSSWRRRWCSCNENAIK